MHWLSTCIAEFESLNVGWSVARSCAARAVREGLDGPGYVGCLCFGVGLGGAVGGDFAGVCGGGDAGGGRSCEQRAASGE